MTSRFSIRRLLKLFSGSRQASWPEPAESTGEFLRQVDNVKYWSATGPARRAFELLSQDIEQELAPVLDSLPTDTIFVFDVYMSGDDRATAHPVVMFICDEPAPRRHAQKIIDNRNILEGFPGMKTGNAAVPPDFDLLDPLASDPVYQHTAGTFSASKPVSIITISGNKISINSVTETGHCIKSATVGGFVQHDTTVYACTAGHVFDEMMLRQGTGKSEVLQNHNTSSADAPENIELLVLSNDLDYALVRIPDSTSILCPDELVGAHTVQAAHVIRAPLKDVTVVAETASAGTIKGILSATHAYTRLPHSKSFQKVFKVKFSQPLAKGDSGSWVMDESSHGLYGHVVAGGGRSAYIMPAHSVFEDVKRKLGGQVSLPHSPHAGEIATNIGRAAAQVNRSPITGSEPLPTKRDVLHHSEIPRKDLKQDSLSWPKIFNTRRDLRSIIDQEDKPWLEMRRIIFNEHYDGTDHNGDKKDSVNDDGCRESSIIRAFMRDDATPDYLVPQIDMVEEFSRGAALHVLQTEQAEYPFKNKAWLGEGGNGWFLSSPTWLTAHELHKALRRPRFKTKRRPVIETTLLNGTTLNANEDIERRIIFVRDLDSWNIYALAGTASTLQACALRSAFRRYLCFESCIELTTLTQGWPTFHLSLHLPYYVWRTSPSPSRDARVDSSGRPLRKSRDVSLLADCSYLHEAQISCIVAGIDEWRWHAYYFVDCFFDNEDGESAKSGQQISTEVSMHEHKPECARSFFLKVLEERSEQICKEWSRVVSNLEGSSRSWFHGFSIQNNHETLKSTRKLLEWLETTSSVLFDLRKVLEGSLKACSRFLDRATKDFIDTTESSAAEHAASINSIRINFIRLQCLGERLTCLNDECNALEMQLNRRLKREEIEVGEQQRHLAEASYLLAQSNKKISNAMMLATPIALTAAVFSMEPAFLPFTPSVTSLLMTLIGSCVVFLVVYHYEATKHEKLLVYYQGAKAWWQRPWPWPAFLPHQRPQLPMYSSRAQSRDPEKDQGWLLANEPK